MSIEHGNFASEQSLKLLRDEANEGRGGYLVPTLVTYDRLRRDGVAGGMAPELVAKVGDLVERGKETLRTAHALGVKVCYGSDLLGDMHAHQAGSIGLHLDAGVDPAASSGHSTARANDARRGTSRGEAGGPPSRDEGGFPLAVAANQRADLIVVDGDVIRDPGVLMDERNVKLVVKAGEVVMRALSIDSFIFDKSFLPTTDRRVPRPAAVLDRRALAPRVLTSPPSRSLSLPFRSIRSSTPRPSPAEALC